MVEHLSKNNSRAFDTIFNVLLYRYPSHHSWPVKSFMEWTPILFIHNIASLPASHAPSTTRAEDALAEINVAPRQPTPGVRRDAQSGAVPETPWSAARPRRRGKRETRETSRLQSCMDPLFQDE